MKKLVISILIFIVALSSVSASLVAYNDPYYDKDSPFSSPAMLIEKNEVIPFAFSVEAYSAVDYLSYLASPAEALSKAADYLYERMMNGDEEFWKENYNAIRNAFGFDSANFPNLTASEITDVEVLELRTYLAESYYGRFTDAHRAHTVLNVLDTTSIFKSGNTPALFSDAVLSLNMYGGAFYDNGFAWTVESNLGFLADTNLLENGSNALAFDIRGNAGYAFNIINPKFSLGVAVEAGVYFENSILSTYLLKARFNNDVLEAFTGSNQPFKLGLGFSLNVGAMYRHNEELAFTLDLTNVAAFRKYTDLYLNDFVNYDGFTSDSDVYYTPMDLIIRAYWDRGPYHLKVEIGDIINQVIYMNMAPSYTFNFYAIPKVYFSYDINNDLSVSTGLEYLKLLLGIDYKGFSAEISCSLDKLGFGITAGYKF